MWNSCWEASTTGTDDEAKKYIVAATNGKSFPVGFCTWEEETTRYCVSKTALGINRTIDNKSLYWHALSRPGMLSTMAEIRQLKLFDIRDGYVLCKWEIDTNVNDIANCNPIKWWTSKKVLIAEDKCVTLWDVSATRGKPIVKFPTIANENIKVLAINTCMQETNYRNLVFEGAYACNNFVYLLDARTTKSSAIALPRGSRVYSLYTFEDSIYVGRSCVRTGPAEKITEECLQISMTGGKIATHYKIPDGVGVQYDAHVTKICAGKKNILVLNESRVFVFQSHPPNLPPNPKSVNNQLDYMNLRCHWSFHAKTTMVYLYWKQSFDD